MNRSGQRNGLLIGAGYFSEFHLDAWRRLEGANIIAVCDLDREKAEKMAVKFGIDRVHDDVAEALRSSDLDFVDIATGPGGRAELVLEVLERGLPIICQKPLANEYATAERIMKAAEAHDQVFMVHENFRFQPWHREIKRLLTEGVIGRRLHSLTMRTRMGDGWSEDAYSARQPYFRTMPRLLVHETGVHFIDTFRYLGGEVTQCFAQLKRLNPAIVGEDAGVIQLTLQSGATAIWDANRYNESGSDDPRYTFGEMWVEADGGTISLAGDGTITVDPIGKPVYVHDYVHSRDGFAGDCVAACQQHFLDVLDGKSKCETAPQEYRKTLQAVEAVYESARRNHPVILRSLESRLQISTSLREGRAKRGEGRRVIDLSLPMTDSMPGFGIAIAKSIENEGWNATTLTMYSHTGTHMDAPRHFVPDGDTLDQQVLSACCGPARLVNLADSAPRRSIGIEDVTAAIGQVYPGDRLLFRTDWHRRFGTPAYRNELPRISLELARWLVQHEVALIGVEPPSVADVNNLAELTDVHQTLFVGGVVIVEGLAHLDSIDVDEFEFVALPLNVVGGDGCPVRAIAIVDSRRHS
ncbi:cyclase family protein [Neorhodopirellula pilleata]|uniref:Kynurenine formamidase n=1 Tax=Neorhodopirellula pilleata TaxID=2714738 RepID=A0A5C6A207_9BACT|nr:cyclase family protein [Neorhodopirellula pilleata]TWT93579.1 Kynurenine formamidase [Neorhodopirellula pilleata]